MVTVSNCPKLPFPCFFCDPHDLINTHICPFINCQSYSFNHKTTWTLLIPWSLSLASTLFVFYSSCSLHLATREEARLCWIQRCMKLIIEVQKLMTGLQFLHQIILMAMSL
ncbi:hypothetical protein CFOL_v3_12368 [Cephalotus follicularis]|uniref:Uncharacterized protein n=1 Tax=Cephalotus follicularis TaxID=3775 RepID=A0A1Q3BLL0_CEPFO|nr:hypothetical protein CFOL_v3_12368 [Cephalotus follicularis]